MKKTISIGLLSAFLLLSGCNIAPSEPTLKTDIVVAEQADIKGFDPQKNVDTYSQKVCSQIYNSLLKQSPDLEIVGDLAESWQYTSDTRVVFKLHEGVLFHNGVELTAKDAEYSLNRAMTLPQSMSYFSHVAGVKALGKYELEVETVKPYEPLLWSLTTVQSSIVNREEVLANGGNIEDPNGTGPFKYESWASNSQVTLARNDNYFAGQGKATSVSFRVMTEPSMALLALETGQVDFVQVTTPTIISRLETNAKIKTASHLAQSVVYLGMNCTKAPFDDIQVRRGISYAIDKEEIVVGAMEGKAMAYNTILPPEMFGADSDLEPYPHNPERAKELFRLAGYPDGFETTLVSYGEEHSKVIQVIQSQLMKYNIKVNIESMQLGRLLEKLNERDNSQMFVMAYGVPGNPSMSVVSLFHSDSSASSGNRFFYSNPQVDQIGENILWEMDYDARMVKIKEAQQVILDDAPIVPLYVPQIYYAYSKGLEGVEIAKNGRHDFHNAVVRVQ